MSKSGAHVAMDARQAALEALLDCDRGKPVQAALDKVLADSGLSRQDMALATELSYGVLRTRIALDALLASVLAKPHKLPSTVRLILAIGLYSLLYAEKIPAHAAIDTAVTLARKKAGSRMGNLVNATLRNLQRSVDGQHMLFSSATGDVWDNLALMYSLPRDIVSLWRKAYGDGACLSLMRRSMARPWVAVRVNAQHPDAVVVRQAFARAAGAFAITPWGFAFPPGATPVEIAGKSLAHWHSEGAFSWQAAASQCVMHKLGLAQLAGEGEQFWDCCAGVGGKSLVLLEAGSSNVLCSDTSDKRLDQCRADCNRLGLRAVSVRHADAAQWTPEDFVGSVLVDAPCSSLGVLARRPDVKKRGFDPASLASFVQQQKAILNNVAPCVGTGRYLAYMTCTLNPAENEQQIAHFLTKHTDFHCVAQWQTPHDHPWLEGMYGALLQKRF